LAEFSKSERRGLERLQIAATQHPDADQLTAFAEQALPSRERAVVLQHLASCSSCREVLAFSSPSQPVPGAAPEARPALWRWPVLRWGAVAASAVIVVAAVSLGRLEHHKAQSSVTAVVSDKAPEQQRLQPQAVPSIPAASVPAAETKRRSEDISLNDSDKLASSQPIAQGRMVAKSSERTDVSTQPVVPGKSASYPTETIEVSSANGMVTVQPTAPSTSAPPAAGNAELDRSAAAKAALPPSNILAKDEHQAAGAAAAQSNAPNATIKKHDVPEAVSGYAAQNTLEPEANMNVESRTREQVPQSKQVQRAKKTQAEQTNELGKHQKAQEINGLASVQTNAWRVNEAGQLQNSLDRGRNWQTVLPNQNFRTVNTVGGIVWAGGQGGVLYRSNDGVNWTTITPRSGDQLMTGDVVGLQFTDALHGIVKTSIGETWSTDDGGITWTKH
jgi:putative zinc finger protein